MQKVISPKLFIIILVTLACVYLTFPTFQYFYFINRMDDPPTPEQVERRNEMLENKRVIKLALDLSGGVDFLMSVDVDVLQRRDMMNEAEGLRNAFARDQVDAAVRAYLEEPTTHRLVIELNTPEELDYATGTIEQYLAGETSLDPVGNIRQELASDEGLTLVPNERMINQRVGEAMEGALRVVRRRVDEFGLTQPIVRRSGRDRIRVQIPGENNPERMRSSLLRTASLEFRLLHPEHDTEIIPFIEGGAQGVVSGPGTGRVRQDLLEEYVVPETGRTATRLKRNITGVPSGYVLRLGRYARAAQDTGIIDPASEISDLVYMVRAEAPLTGADLRRASVYTDPTDFTDPVKVSIEFNREGAREFCRITEGNVNRRFAIILDDVVYSAPNINEPICGGSAQISGGFTQTEAFDLSTILRAGALPAPLRVITENAIGPSLGADSIRDSGKAIMIGGAFIILLMLVVYAHCGAIAVTAMILNLLLILAVLSLMGATLSLSGIGGILLTMGMAVDANILIYERLREELATGKPLRAAINTAFGRAYSVILDSNVTSLLPALVLVLFEVVEGTAMRGFWTAIAIGLLANLYTGIVVTRALAEAWYAKFKSLSVGKLRFLQNVKFDWMRYRVVGIVVSGGLTVAAAGYLIVAGPSFGIDFTGGVLAVAEVRDENVRQTDVRGLFTDDFPDVRAIKVVGKEQWQLTVPQTPNPETGIVPSLDEIRSMIDTRLNTAFPGVVTIESVESVEPDVGGEFRMVAIMSLIITCAVILTYVAFRFQWVFGAAAVMALSHDVFLALGIFKMLGHTLTLDIVSALLIILGYSVNDTIVVFDRIREKMQERYSADIREVINQGINETLSRTVLTSGSTLMAISVMYLFGGAGLSNFALILLIGMALGTYSSIFVASVLVYTYLKHKGMTTVIAARKATTRVATPRARAKADA